MLRWWWWWWFACQPPNRNCFPSFTFIFTRQGTLFLRPWTLTYGLIYDLELAVVKTKPFCEISTPEVILLERYRRDTHTHTIQTDCVTWTTDRSVIYYDRIIGFDAIKSNLRNNVIMYALLLQCTASAWIDFFVRQKQILTKNIGETR